MQIGNRFQAKPGKWIGAKIGLFAVKLGSSEKDSYVEYDYDDPDWSQDKHSLWSGNPDFTDVNNHNYHIGLSSVCLDKGNYLTTPSYVSNDKDGNERTDPPDIGVYEHIETIGTISPPTALRIIQ